MKKTTKKKLPVTKELMLAVFRLSNKVHEQGERIDKLEQRIDRLVDAVGKSKSVRNI